MPRVSLRRAFLYFGAVASVSLLLVAVHAPGGTFIPIGSQSGLRRPTGYAERPGLVIGDELQQIQNSAAGSASVVKATQTRQSGESDGQKKKRRNSNDLESSALKAEGEDGPDQRRLFVKEVPTAALPANHTTILPHERPWYMKGGKRMPQSNPGERKLLLWPDEDSGDRIPAQLMYKPPPPPPQDVDHPDIADSERSQPALKKILMFNGMSSWNLKAGRGQFLKLKCPVDTCVLTGSRSDLSSADAVVFKDHFSLPQQQRNSNQAWIMYMLECPLHTQHFAHANVFNWTATYRHDSDLVAPYERWVYHDPFIKQMDQGVNYAINKTKQVAWFVSNCGARNNRLQYAKELSRYIGVDIYGACGTKRCPRSNSARCFDMLNRDYKFYLAFENSNCRDYITEKFFVNGLRVTTSCPS
uniref:Fucosyltransferase n=1 Tax=Hirondellea gigas TaxID=1518452 RepID=A0A6A7FRF1_9CRUS